MTINSFQEIKFKLILSTKSLHKWKNISKKCKIKYHYLDNTMIIKYILFEDIMLV